MRRTGRLPKQSFSRLLARRECYRVVLMERIGVRELRQNASEWIHRAHAGEHIEVTRHGQVMAVIGPPPRNGALAALRTTGRLKPASAVRPLPTATVTRRPASEALGELRRDER